MKKIALQTIKSPLFYILLLSLAIHSVFLLKHPGLAFYDLSIFGEYNVKQFGDYLTTYGSRDAAGYVQMAERLLQNHLYSFNFADKPDAFVTPAQPIYLVIILFLSKVFHADQRLMISLANMILSIGTVALVYLTTQRLFQKKLISSLSALAYVTYFSGYHFFRTALTETPTNFMFMLSIFVFVLAYQKRSVKYHILFGFAASITIMFRPTPAPILLLLWAIMIGKEGWKTAIRIGFIWCIGAVLVMGPWVLRNVVSLGSPYLFSDHSGDVFMTGADPYFQKGAGKLYEEMTQQGYDFKSEKDLKTYANTLITNGFKNDFPLWFSWYTIGKPAVTFEKADSLWLYGQYFSPRIMSLLALQHNLLMIVSLISMFLFRKNKAILTLTGGFLFYIILSNMFLPLTRYGFLMIPLLAIIAGYGTGRVYEIVLSFIKRMNVQHIKSKMKA